MELPHKEKKLKSKSGFGVCGQFTAVAGKRGELADLLLEAATVLQGIPDCHEYVISEVRDEPDALWVTEVWADQDAHARSLQNDQVRTIISKAMPLIAGMTQQVHLTPLGGKGLS